LELGLCCLSERSESLQFRTTLCVLETPKSHPVRAATLVAAVECEQVKKRRHEQFGSRLDVHGSMHHSTSHIEITNKMEPCTRIYYSIALLIAQHVSSDTPVIIRNSKTVIAASGFTYVCGCRQLPATTDVCKTRGRNYSF